MSMIHSRRGLAGFAVVCAAVFVWIIIVTLWYQPASLLDLSDNTNLLIALWWTIICGVSVFIGLQIEKNQGM